MKNTKIQKLINALKKRSLTVRQIASSFKIPNVYAIVDDIRKVHGFNVQRTTTRSGLTAYMIVA